MESQKFCKLYIVRHGQAMANLEKIVAGHTDSPLTTEGEKQAEQRGRDLSEVEFAAAFSSDLARAKRTAEIISLNRKLAVNTKTLLRERNFGEWEGRLEKEVMEENEHLFEKLKTLSEKEKRNFKFNQGYETGEEITGRFITILREIAAAYLDKTVLVVSHGSIMRLLLMHLGFGSYDELPAGSIDNTGYIVLESDGVDFFIKQTVGINKAKQ